MDLNNVVDTVNYGKIVITLDKTLEKTGVSKFKLAKLTNLDYRVISRLTDGNRVNVDLDTLARICYVLKCDLPELMHYEI